MPVASMVNDTNFTITLLAHLVHVSNFLNRAVQKLRIEDFGRPGERVHQLIFATIADYYVGANTDVDKRIPASNMVMQLNVRVKEAPGAYEEHEITFMQGMVEYLYKEETVQGLMSADYMLEQLQFFLNDRRVLLKAAELAKANPMDLDARLAELSQEHAATRIVSGSVLDEFFRPENISIVPQIRDVIGVDFVDLLLGGGTTPGEVYGVIGPFGMGKTTLSVQCFCEGASRKRHSLYVLYEQPFLGDVSNRVYGYMGGIPRSRMAGQTFETLHIEDQQRLQARLADCWPYMHVVDMVKDPRAGGGGPEGIASILQQYKEKGIHIELVYLDQYLPFIRSWMAVTNQSEDNLRTVMEGTVYKFMTMAAPDAFDCCFFLLHQTSTEGASRSATAVPKPTDSAECRSFPFWLSTFIQLGVQDGQRRQFVVSGKGRATTRKDFIVECDGENWRYEYVPDRFSAASGSFVNVAQQTKAHDIQSPASIDNEGLAYLG